MFAKQLTSVVVLTGLSTKMFIDKFELWPITLTTSVGVVAVADLLRAFDTYESLSDEIARLFAVRLF